MAAVQNFYPFPQGKGTLMPGQTIVVNKHTIHVERYLSQGGFAHVYLVRTATPVYNTTHHVLKRIAVSDQSMLAEVKKEVDIMRLLKGHPNIVHFIDAAWHKMPNGMFEVFILMEYCPGGGIIDMMNRRLRERLTEAEILQIFVDVCESVAYMHNLRPPLLHRDLKVENILQSSQSSYKLCDFGSATAVSRPPSNMQELRLLEADLNKHTTMQYRAPEMIDVHMRRPIDEKSDVWALGVLLYKLCYYTTPFEEHGPLAILQVSYRIPPYPVYSAQMNALIGKMLKDHGTMRPTIFEVLTDVHRMRGTKSQFQYTVAMPQPLSPSRAPHAKRPSISTLDGVITYKSSKTSSHKQQTSISSSPAKNQGQIARDKVMEANAPMRRGRPSPSKELSRESRLNSRQSSPQKESGRLSLMGDKLKTNLSEINLADDEKAWKSWIAEVKQAAKPSSSLDDDAWNVASEKENVQVNNLAGFTDNFAEKLGPSTEASASYAEFQSISIPKSAGLSSSLSKETTIPMRNTPQSATGILSRRIPLPRSGKDAFDDLGLGLPSEKHEPTLGEARKLRTGLAIFSSTRPKLEVENRPSVSPRPSYLTPQPYLQTQGFLSTSPSNTSSNSSVAQIASRPPSSTNIDGMPIESRFPSLEELDATFSAPAKSQGSARPSISARSTVIGNQASTSATQQGQNASDAKPNKTGDAAIKEKQGSSHTRILELANDIGNSLVLDKGRSLPSTMVGGVAPRRVSSLSLKPTVTRRQRSSISFKQRPSTDDNDTSLPSQHVRPQPSARDEGPPRSRTPPSKSSRQHRDWLTGDDNFFSPFTPPHTVNTEIPILRQSPSKRASVVEKSDIVILEAIAAQPEHASDSSTTSNIDVSPTIAKFSQQFPPIDNSEKGLLSDAWDTSVSKEPDSSSSSADEGPEDVNGVRAIVKSGPLGRQSRRRSSQSSVHDLGDPWSGPVQYTKHTERRTERQKKRMTATPSPLKTPPTLLPRSSSPEVRTSLLHPTTPASGGISPPSAKPRPQSMLVLPSRSADNSQSNRLLEAPPETKRRQSIRRTSITDMVERYEAMGGSSKSASVGTPVASPHAIRKSISSKSASQNLDGSHSLNSWDTGASLAIPPSPSTSPARQRASPTRLLRTSAGITSSPSTDFRIYPESPRTAETPEVHKASPFECTVPRPRRLSLKPHENPKPPVSLQDLLASDERKERSISDRSPSPERSYQGVGRLIDQWQRKAEEADPRTSGGVKRNSIVTKRPAAAGKG